MSILNNINGPVTPLNTKTISKVSLHLGDRFKGELINMEGEEALILLPEGYKLRARIVGNVKEAYLSQFLFQLEDFKDGKVFLKIIDEDASEEFKGDSKNKFFKEGISSEDKDLAELLLKHNIALTKSNLSFVKSVFFLRGDSVKGEEYIDKLLDKYIKLKSGSFEHLKEGEVKLKLKEAFKEIASLTKEDLIIFLENDIALSKDNIMGYRKLNNSTGILFEAFKSLGDKIELHLMDKEILPKEIDSSLEFFFEDALEENLYSSQDRDTKEAISKSVKEPSARGDSLYNVDFSDEKSVYPNIKANNKSENITKSIDEKFFVEKNEEKALADAKLTENESGSISERKEIDQSVEKGTKFSLEELAILKSFKEEAMTELLHKGKELKVMIKDIIEEINEGNISKALEKELDIKAKDFKLINQLSKEYYYSDIPLTIFKKEFPLKLIIKDSREGGKTIDSKDLRLVISVAAPRLGVIDGYLEIKEKNLKANISVPKDALELFKANKEKLLISLKTLGYNTDIQFTIKEEGQEISPLIKFFQQDNSVLVDVLV